MQIDTIKSSNYTTSLVGMVYIYLGDDADVFLHRLIRGVELEHVLQQVSMLLQVRLAMFTLGLVATVYECLSWSHGSTTLRGIQTRTIWFGTRNMFLLVRIRVTGGALSDTHSLKC
jgi:hypothetical protein